MNPTCVGRGVRSIITDAGSSGKRFGVNGMNNG